MVTTGGWREMSLREVGRCLRGVSYDPGRDLRVHPSNQTVRLLRSTNVQGGRLDFQDVYIVDAERVYYDQILRDHDVVICMANGSKSLVGKTAPYTAQAERHTFGAFMGCFRPDSRQVHPQFCRYIFLSERYNLQIRNLLAGSAINNLTPSNIESLTFVAPPLREQEAIAEALSDADAEIEAVDALIAKKRDMKQAAMQQLLTGRSRLQGFSKVWGRAKLGQMLAYQQPTQFLVSSDDYSAGSIPVLTAGKTFRLGNTSETSGVYEKLPTILFDDFTTACQWVDFPFKVKSSACKMLTARHPETNLRYVFEQLHSLEYVPSDHKRHWLSTFVNMEIPEPTRDEQDAIAACSLGMASEIDALVAQREKLVLVKQGMMQELLSGRVRLV